MPFEKKKNMKQRKRKRDKFKIESKKEVKGK
jgi:hypothetical protein